MSAFFHSNLSDIIRTAGYLGLFCIVFAESGLFFGFFFPGDSLLFTAGLLASQGYFSIWLLSPLLALAAIAGDSAGYWFGKKAGPRLFSREDSFFFHKKHLHRAQNFYAAYGPRAILLSRLVPVVRTFVPIFAGAGRMPYRVFLIYNILGGVLWGAGVTCIGYFLGGAFPQTQNYLLPISLVIIVISLLPLIKEFRL